jgi:hypothetical protein
MKRSFFATVGQLEEVLAARLAGGAVGALGVALRALQAEDLDGLLEVAVGLLERLLGVDHARAELLAQRLDVGDGEVCHGWWLLDRGEWMPVRDRARRDGTAECVCYSAAVAAASPSALASAPASSAADSVAMVSTSATSVTRRLGASARPSSSSRSQSASGSASAASSVGWWRWMRPSAAASAMMRVSRPPSGSRRRCRDRELELVGVGVGVEDADHGDAELLGLVDREVLALGVDDPDRRRRLLQVADAAERLVQLVELALLEQELLLREARVGGVVEVELLELLHAREALADRLEVGEQATEPALVDVGLADARRLLGDDFLRLLLGADEQDGAAVGDGLLDELVRLVDVAQRLLQVDDVDAGALGQDEALHLRVPPTGLVSEVDAAVEQLANGDDGHGRSPLFWVSRSTDRPMPWCPAHTRSPPER